MVAIQNFGPAVTETTSLSPEIPLPTPSITTLTNNLHDLRSFQFRPVIILSAAGLGLVIALAVFVFICWRTKKSTFGNKAGVAKTKVSLDNPYGKLKLLKLLEDEKYAITDAISLPSKPPNSLRPHRPRQPSIKSKPSTAIPSRANSAAHPAPPFPMPAFTLDDIPALCSPPSTSPKEIFGWIQSDSVLLWNDGYSVAREDSRLFISTAFQDPICCPPDAKAGTGSTNTRSNAKAKTTSTLANEAVKSRNSLFSSSTLNRTSRKKQLGSASLCFSAGPRSISSSTTICSSPSPRPQPLTQSQMNGATLVPSMRDLSDDLGPLEQGTRWGLNWYTLEKPVSISRLKVEGMNGRGKDKRKENSSLRVKLGKENLGV